MEHVDQFTNGLLNPVLAYVMSCVGMFLGLRCAARARAYVGAARAGWHLLAALSIGATGIWVMHNIAMLGFSIPGQTIRYNVPLSVLSAAVAIAVVGIGLFIVGFGNGNSAISLVLGALIIGCGVLVSMDYIGMSAMIMPDVIHFNIVVVILSVLMAVAAAAVALWAALRVHGFRSTLLASLIMGAAVSGMHYTVMAAVKVYPAPDGGAAMPTGASVMEFLLPFVAGVSIITLLLTVTVALSPTEEEIRAENALMERLSRRQQEQVRK
jgi:NO-binding membrane sensor protein with MHYT domain